MTDPRDRGAAPPLPTRGEGCLQRFEPEAMSAAHGADFSQAAELWQALQSPLQSTEANRPVNPDDPA